MIVPSPENQQPSLMEESLLCYYVELDVSALTNPEFAANMGSMSVYDLVSVFNLDFPKFAMGGQLSSCYNNPKI